MDPEIQSNFQSDNINWFNWNLLSIAFSHWLIYLSLLSKQSCPNPTITTTFVIVAVLFSSLYLRYLRGFFWQACIPCWQSGERRSPRNLTCVPYTGSRYRHDPGIKRFHAKKPVHQGVPLGWASLCEKSRSTSLESCLEILRPRNQRT